MQSIKLYVLTFITIFAFSCKHEAQTNPKQDAVINVEPVQVKVTKNESRAYFASGCFWCVESIYESVIGVKEVISGYSGGHTKNPTYEASNTGKTGHAEAVEVIYNPSVIDFATLVDVYFGSQDPMQANGQGPDYGSQYRSIIFYQNDVQKQIILKKKSLLEKTLGKKVVAEVYPFQKFWEAEAYHQDYKKHHPNNGYIQNVSIPRTNAFKKKFPKLLKENQ
ncbi:peptide methionine sulfoxide reductase MsrA [Formosa agariphila KMM 3901]|uniref:Peptide methionine sulfoxide reductase MsrA n=1 Tax=Formosa agariphila (strain DSM 15362 / KCTC 12365 / LMG 23005 / KMM 3901 / M-2Alg 35-1) TaxID=1347342 RepID=T2KP26_FORAG|nr:peptide-methionine (S)-S-oxide reductase MsrA [Formosa agariphila]CDF80500.1 peptide methionine sulfoxide reductase MsrA [Formosa agariphila KMM 3901]